MARDDERGVIASLLILLDADSIIWSMANKPFLSLDNLLSQNLVNQIHFVTY